MLFRLKDIPEERCKWMICQNNANASVPAVRGEISERMMCMPVLNRMEPFYRERKEILVYLLFGGADFDSVVAQVVVVLLNYVISKPWGF